MGKDLSGVVISQDDRIHYRQKVRRCLDVLALMLDDSVFAADCPMTGLEIELNLMDADAEPAMRNAEILAGLADPTFQTELGQFNLELNARPRLIGGNGFADYEQDIIDSLARAEDRAKKSDRLVTAVSRNTFRSPSASGVSRSARWLTSLANSATNASSASLTASSNRPAIRCRSCWYRWGLSRSRYSGGSQDGKSKSTPNRPRRVGG